MIVKYLFFTGLCAGVTLCCAQDVPQKYVAAFKTDAKIKVDGKLGKSEWKQAKKEADFIFPWLKRKAPITHFYAILDTQYLNFVFQVDDRDIVVKDFTKESDVAQGDRVEIFFAKRPDLKEYYCLEIGPNAKVLDYKASFYRSFDDTWDCEDLLVAAKIKSNGYVVEGRIPIEVLKGLGIFDPIESGSCFLMGLYRAEYSRARSDKPQVEWISWVRPDSAEPDFHVPSSFGLFCSAPK